MIRRLFLACLLIGFASVGIAEDRFSVEKVEDGVIVKHRGKLLTHYRFKSGAKPILWPVIGPGGVEMTRSYPMVAEGKEGEKKDHVHHRSFFFTHGDINGVDFWAETPNHGVTVHKEVKIKGGDQATIVTRNDWMGPDGKKHLEDERTITFGEYEGAVYIDFDIELMAPSDVVFGDTKEGSFGIRVAGTMRTELDNGGEIVTSEGDTNAGAWGKAASWVDYHGPVNGKQVGVAILNHPSSFRYPTHWHVRTYGLFAANPFGLKAFTKGKENGEYKMKKGESITLRYRVLLHSGAEKEGHVADAFKAYAATQK